VQHPSGGAEVGQRQERGVVATADRSWCNREAAASAEATSCLPSAARAAPSKRPCRPLPHGSPSEAIVSAMVRCRFRPDPSVRGLGVSLSLSFSRRLEPPYRNATNALVYAGER
jgi:hypothetical protein